MACGSFTSDSFTSARSIIVAISNVPAIADAGASRCAPQWLHATRPKTEDQNVLPILRSKMPPIIPNAQAEGRSGGGLLPQKRFLAHSVRYLHPGRRFAVADAKHRRSV